MSRFVLLDRSEQRAHRRDEGQQVAPLAESGAAQTI
jgi:hypothetical protein